MDGLVTCRLTACTLRSSPGPTLGNEYGRTSPLPPGISPAVYIFTWKLTILAMPSFVVMTVVCVCLCIDSEFYWANYATGLGAALHELGHTFDLAHSPTGVMSRGFDDIHRFFTVVSPVTSFRGLTSSCHVQRSCSPVACSATQSPLRRPAVCHHFTLSLLNQS